LEEEAPEAGLLVEVTKVKNLELAMGNLLQVSKVVRLLSPFVFQSEDSRIC